MKTPWLVTLLRWMAVISLIMPFSPPPALAQPAAGQIGNGTPQSCTAQAVFNAVEVGGTWLFACGAQPKTIVIAPDLYISTTTTLQAAQPGLIILSGGNLNRVFHVDDDAELTLQGIIVTDGNSGADDGGAIKNRGTLVLNQSQVLNSHTGPGYAGGGIFNTGEATLTSSTVRGNSAGNGGGLADADYNTGTFMLIKTAVVSNTADFGGGLFSYGNVSLLDAVFDGNTASSGGAIYFRGGDLSLTTSTISHNRAVGGCGFTAAGVGPSGGCAGYGGGLYITSTASLNQVTLNGNSAEYGAGLLVDAPGLTVTVAASTFNGNHAQDSGGGLRVTEGSVALLNVTLSGNTAVRGAGLYHVGYRADLTHVTLANNVSQPGLGGGIDRHSSATGPVTLFASVLDDNIGDNCVGTITSNENNLSSDMTCGLSNDGDQQGVDPLLLPLANNGGPTRTHYPGAGSPLLGGGPVATCAAADQRGVARPTTDPCDIGAVQVDPAGPVLGCGGEFTALADATIDQASPTTAAGLTTTLQVKRSVSGVKWTLLNFDLSAIPSGAAVHTARLVLNQAAAASPLPLPLRAQEVGPWNEATVTWNTAPAAGAAYTLPVAGLVNGAISLDVSALVTRWLNGEALPGGLALQPAGTVPLTSTWVSRQDPFATDQAPLLVIECAPPVSGVPADETAADADQAASADQLNNDSSDPVSLQFIGSAVRFGSFRLAIPPEVGSDPVARAQWFLDNFRDLLRLPDPASELQLERFSDDGLHLFFRQVHAGVPVFPASLVVHLDHQSITGVSGGYVPGITLGAEPVLTRERAEALALAAGGPTASLQGDTQLRYLSLDLLGAGAGGLYLTWAVHLLGGSRPGDNYVDALSGEVRYTEATVNEGYDLDLEDGNFQLPKDLCYFANDNIDRNDLPPDSQSATDNFHMVYYAWLHTFGRDSYDDDGEQMEVNINVNFPNNAAYNPCDQFFFGSLMLTPDIVGHEFTHAVDDSEGGLIYANQSGALDESFADIFGHMVDDDDWLMGENSSAAVAPNGKPGCGVIAAGRDMSNPPCFNHPDHILAGVSGDTQGLRTLPPGQGPDCNTASPTYNDCGFVHTNSGINNKAAFLVTQGGSFNTYTITGIGQTKAEHLFYGVLINRMFKNAQLIDARNAAVADAQLNAASSTLGFTLADVCSVRNAYAAVGLGNGDRDCDGLEDNVDPDLDADGRPNALDNCPTTWNPGQTNTDGDALGDACDTDKDNDGVADNADNCPTVINADQANTHGGSAGDACDDTDQDGRWDNADNCPEARNPGQEDLDGDRFGDVCDDDLDGDWVDNPVDNCPLHRNYLQEDTTEAGLSLPADGVGDACDLCPTKSSSDNRDLDHDGLGNPCDDDDDGDGYLDGADNCPETFSPSQLDWDHDGLGLVCDADEQVALGALLSHINQTYVHLRNFRTPLPICVACATNYLPVNYNTVIHLTLPVEFKATVVNSAGQVVAKGIGSGLNQTLKISPLAFGRTVLAGHSSQSLAGATSDLPLTEFGPEAIRYYLVIETAPGTDLSQAYPLSLSIYTDQIFLPLTLR